MRRLTALVLVLAAFLPSSAVAHDPYSGDSVFPRGLPHAPFEDSCWAHRCVWDAQHDGNGDGQSVILTEYRGRFLVTPISHRRAHWLQDTYCERPDVGCRGYTD